MFIFLIVFKLCFSELSYSAPPLLPHTDREPEAVHGLYVGAVMSGEEDDYNRKRNH